MWELCFIYIGENCFIYIGEKYNIVHVHVYMNISNILNMLLTKFAKKYSLKVFYVLAYV